MWIQQSPFFDDDKPLGENVKDDSIFINLLFLTPPRSMIHQFFFLLISGKLPFISCIMNIINSFNNTQHNLRQK